MVTEPKTGVQLDADTIIAICAVFVSLVATLLAAWSMFAQQKHNRLSVKPAAGFAFNDYENVIGVAIFNNGLGPLKISKLLFSSKEDEASDALYKLMPDLKHDALWSNYRSSLDGYVLRAGATVELLSLIGDPESDEFVENRDMIRHALSVLSASVCYEDFYGQEMPVEQRSFDWFSRHVAETSGPVDNKSS